MKIVELIKNSGEKTFLNIKFAWKGGKCFPANFFYYFTMIAQKHYKMKQMTDLRRNLHDEVNIFEKYPFS